MNKHFEQTSLKAASVIKNHRKTTKLLAAAVSKSSSGKALSQISEISEKIKALVRMVRCYSAREYLDVPWQTMLLITAALIYFVSPFDAIADFIPLIGFADDIAIISAVFSSIIQDVDRFIAWEKAKSSGAEMIACSVPDDQQ